MWPAGSGSASRNSSYSAGGPRPGSSSAARAELPAIIDAAIAATKHEAGFRRNSADTIRIMPILARAVWRRRTVVVVLSGMLGIMPVFAGRGKAE